MYINEQHLLIGNVRWVRSPNHGGYLEGKQPDTVVIHYTAGSSTESSVRSLCDPTSKASAHLVIGRDGSVLQLVPFHMTAWHAGASEHRESGRRGINRYSIGIELDNAGVLTRQNEDSYLSWFGRSYPRAEVIEAVHRNEEKPAYWHTYTDIQLRTCLEICQLIAHHYPIRYLVGHEEISPGRKRDPGPAFPLDRFREKVLNLDRSDGEEDASRLVGKTVNVNIDWLNIRKGPGVEFPKAAEALAGGTAVVVHATQDKWCEVSAGTTRGWVNGKYLIE